MSPNALTFTIQSPYENLKQHKYDILSVAKCTLVE